MAFTRVTRKINEWRQQPEPVRLRIATYLTGAAGLAIVALWLVVLLPLQLMLTRPSTNEAAPTGVVAGIEDVVSPTPSPTPSVEYYNGTRPTFQEPQE